MSNGAKYERELQEKLNNLENTIFQRVTGSGCREHGNIADLIGYYGADPIISYRLRFFIIEVKSTFEDKYYLSNDLEQLQNLERVVRDAGLRPFLAVRFKRPPKWIFVELSHRFPTFVARDSESFELLEVKKA